METKIKKQILAVLFAALFIFSAACTQTESATSESSTEAKESTENSEVSPDAKQLMNSFTEGLAEESASCVLILRDGEREIGTREGRSSDTALPSFYRQNQNSSAYWLREKLSSAEVTAEKDEGGENVVISRDDAALTVYANGNISFETKEMKCFFAIEENIYATVRDWFDLSDFAGIMSECFQPVEDCGQQKDELMKTFSERFSEGPGKAAPGSLFHSEKGETVFTLVDESTYDRSKYPEGAFLCLVRESYYVENERAVLWLKPESEDFSMDKPWGSGQYYLCALTDGKWQLTQIGTDY